MKALGLLDQPPYLMDEKRRHLVLQTIRQVSAHRGWTSFAAHLRTNHVHAVLQADDRPEKVMNAFKVWSSRR
jgi:REP element-mobilizing transposase RayT